MQTKVEDFLIDNDISFNWASDHYAVFEELPFSDKELVALSKFWGLSIENPTKGVWIIDKVEVRIY